MTRANEHPIALSEIWRAVGRYRLRFVLTFFLAATAVMLAGLLLPRKYRGEAIFERRTDMVLAEIVHRGAPQSFQDPRQSVTEEIAGPPAIDKLIEKLGPALTDNATGRALDKNTLRTEIARRINVRYDISTTNLDRIRVTYTCDRPATARAVVNTLVTNFIDRTKVNMDQRLRLTRDFFKSEVERNRALIEQLENQKLTFEIDNGQLLPEGPFNLQLTLVALQTELDSLAQQRDAAAMRIETFAEALADTPRMTAVVVRGRNPRTGELENRLRELETQRDQSVVTLKMTARHPDLQALEQQIADARARLQAEPAEIVTSTSETPNPKHAELELQLAQAQTDHRALEAQVKVVQARIAQLNAEAGSLFPVRADYRKLTREAEQVQRQLAFWEDNYRRVEMALTAESGNRGVLLDFIKPCDNLTLPVSPRIAQVLMAAVGAGMLLSIVCVFLSYRGEESFDRGEACAAAFGLTLFGTTGQLTTRAQRRFMALRDYLIYPAGAAALAAILLAMTALVYRHLEWTVPMVKPILGQVEPTEPRQVEPATPMDYRDDADDAQVQPVAAFRQVTGG